MKTIVTITLVAVTLCAIGACTRSPESALTGPSAFGSALNSSANADARSVTGSAEVTQQEGVTYRNSVDGRLTADGQVSGKFTVNILDLSGFGEPEVRATLTGTITCLSFEGDSVWFGGDVTSSSDKSLIENPALLATLGQVKVTGGQSSLHSGPALFYAPPGTKCTDHPALPIRPVNNGGFQIR